MPSQVSRLTPMPAVICPTVGRVQGQPGRCPGKATATVPLLAALAPRGGDALRHPTNNKCMSRFVQISRGICN